jgi:phosphoribosylamine--glycine ligase
LRDYITAQDRRNNWVVKADGLAGGKGAVVCDSPAEAIAVGKKMLVDDLFGAAGRTVVLEERLAGRELSCMYFCDGENFRLLPIAQDYKRIFDGDGGGNTGGMGSLCPSPFWTPELATRVAATIITPVLRTMRERGTPYQGILYAGLMLTEAGPQVIEFNCRLGDPETQTMLAIWPGNFAQHALACVAGDLSGIAEPEAHGHAVCVVLSAEGYPDTYTQGIRLALVADDPASYTLHAGTVLKDDACISTGGRVLNAIGIGSSLAEARAQAYALTGRLRVPRLHYRTDIGL